MSTITPADVLLAMMRGYNPHNDFRAEVYVNFAHEIATAHNVRVVRSATLPPGAAAAMTRKEALAEEEQARETWWPHAGSAIIPTKVINEVQIECARRAVTYIEPEDYNKDGFGAWSTLITDKLKKARRHYACNNTIEVRYHYIQIAALIVAAIESLDRKAGS